MFVGFRVANTKVAPVAIRPKWLGSAYGSHSATQAIYYISFHELQLGALYTRKGRAIRKLLIVLY